MGITWGPAFVGCVGEVLKTIVPGIMLPPSVCWGVLSKMHGKTRLRVDVDTNTSNYGHRWAL